MYGCLHKNVYTKCTIKITIFIVRRTQGQEVRGSGLFEARHQPQRHSLHRLLHAHAQLRVEGTHTSLCTVLVSMSDLMHFRLVLIVWALNFELCFVHHHVFDVVVSCSVYETFHKRAYTLNLLGCTGWWNIFVAGFCARVLCNDALSVTSLFQDAYNHVLACCANARPNRGFVRQLAKFEHDLLGKNMTDVEDPNF